MSNARRPSGAPVPSLPLTQTNPIYQVAYTALERKKFLPLVKKKQHLRAIQSITEGDVEALFPGNQAKGLRQEMRLLHTDIVSAGLGKSKQEKAWRSHYASSILASIYVAMEMRKGVELPTPSIHQRASRSRSSNDATRALPLFRTIAKAVKQAVDKQQDEEIEKLNKGSSIKQQRDGKRKQDKIPFDPTKAESFACPKCGGMNCCMPVETTDEVNQKNREAFEKYTHKMEEYERTGEGKKPKFPTSKGQLLGCWAYKIHCKYQADGGNCPECSKPGAEYLHRDADGKPTCSCPTCNSCCSILFNRQDLHRAAFQADKEATNRLQTEQPASNYPQFFHRVVGSTLQNGAIDAALATGHAVDDPANVQDAYGYAGSRLLAEDSIQGNLTMRDALNKEYGPMGTQTKAGVSIHALRKGRTGANPNPNPAAPRGFGIPNRRELQQQQPRRQPQQQAPVAPQLQPQAPTARGPPTFNHQDARFHRNRLGASTTPQPLNTSAGPPLATKLANAASGSSSGSGAAVRPRPAVAVAAAMPPPAPVSTVSTKRSYSTRGSSSLNPISILESDSESSGFSLCSAGKLVDVKPVVVKSEFKLPPLPKRRKASVPATPSFARKIRQESLKQSLGNNTPSTMKALDLLYTQLTAEDTSTEGMALKKRAQDMENLCPNVEQATGSLVKFAKRQLFAKQGKQACPAPSNTGGLNLLSAAASTAAGLKRPTAAGRGGLGLKRVAKRVVKRSALSKPVVVAAAAAKKAAAVPSKKASPGGLPSSQSSAGFDYGDSD